jgi:DNA-binding LacI/PurR family transcriptional regulator
MIGEHLAGLGHREVAMIVGSMSPAGQVIAGPGDAGMFPYSRRRLAGFREVFPDCAVAGGGWNTADSGRVAAAALLDRPDPPSAVAADSDVLALGALDEARRRNKDISITGVDDIAAAAAAGLTTVRQPIREKGRVMGRMLLDPTFTETRVLLPVELVVRSTTRPCSGRSSG